MSICKLWFNLSAKLYHKYNATDVDKPKENYPRFRIRGTKPAELTATTLKQQDIFHSRVIGSEQEKKVNQRIEQRRRRILIDMYLGKLLGFYSLISDHKTRENSC